MGSLSPVAKMQFFDNNGNLLAGGKLYTYETGTTTPLATYTNTALSVANANPIILDARGEATIYLQDAAYRFLLTDSVDATIWTRDGVSTDIYQAILDGKVTRHVDSVASLKALTGMANNTYAITASYYAGGSTGSGVYRYDSGSSATDNGGTVIAPNSGGGRWILLYENLHVDQFGAKGDGATDDAAKIQAAIDATPSRGALLWGPKEYKIATALSLSRAISLIGLGKGITRLLCASCSGFVGSTNFSFLTINGISIAHDVRYTTTPNANTAIRLSVAGSNDWHSYTDIFIDGFAEAFYAGSCNSCVWQNVTSVYTFGGITAAGSGCINNQVSQCSFSCNDSIATATVAGSYGFKIGDGTTNCEGFAITDCLVFGVARGVWNNASINVVVRGCILDAIGEYGVLQQSTGSAGCINNTYDNNYIGMRGTADTAIYLTNAYAATDSQNRGTTVRDNEVTVYATYSYNYGILIDGAYEKRNTVSGNKITGAATFDCRITGGASHRVSDNYFGTNGFSTTIQVQYINNTGTVASAAWPSPQGTFTPVVFGTTAAGTGTYSIQIGSYKLIDNIVYFNLRAVFTGHTGTGDMKISGLPIASKNVANYISAIVVNAENLTFPAATTSIIGFVGTNSTQIELRGSGSGTAPIAVAMDAAANINISGFYEIS